MPENTWSEKDIEILRAIDPSIEKLLGETDFPPSIEHIHSFIDHLSAYGFHVNDMFTADNILKEGLITDNGNGNVYFICDRLISEEDIGYFAKHNQSPPNRKILAPEYFGRLKNSIECGMYHVSGRGGRDENKFQKVEMFGYGILIINRDLVVPKEENNNPNITERRGKGFIQGYNFENEPTLDEGAFSPELKIIPADAFRGIIIPDSCLKNRMIHPLDRFIQGKDDVPDIIRQFYEIIVTDYLSLHKKPIISN